MKSLLLIPTIALFSGCVQKNTDNSYPVTYSYHSYHERVVLPSLQVEPPLKNKKLISSRSKDITSDPKPQTFYNSYYQQNNFLSENIEETAKSHLGKTYVWGANGPYTFDCSGFTKSVFREHGIKIPRVSRDQAKVGQIIPMQQLVKGDLIFFDSKKSSRVSHVGIYLGEGKFIHASSSKKRVVVSKLGSSYYTKHFKWGRRLSPPSVYARR